MNFQKLIKEVEQLEENSVIAICGFGGSGKSTLAQKISDAMSDVVVVSIDDFIYGGLKEKSSDWKGIDWEYFQESIITPLRNGKKELRYFRYNFETGEKDLEREMIVAVGEIVLIEGVGILREDTMDWYDLSVWIDCPLEEAGKRGLARDRDIYKSSQEHLDQWENIWIPNDKNYFKKHRPDQLADIVYPYEK